MRLALLVACFWLATSPLLGKIVFYSKRDGNTEIYTMNSDGTNQRRLTFNEASDGLGSWSPNGRQIVFDSERDGNWEVYVMNADGTNQHRLTHHPRVDADPDWSPDGSQIAFLSAQNGGPDHKFNIFVMDTDGGNVRQVTDSFFAQRPRWSPDGEWILFMEGDIFAIRPDGTDRWQVSAPHPEASVSLGGWSPDGTQILYVEALNSNVNNAVPIIATLAPNRREVINWNRVELPRMALHSVTFSADGKSILFSGARNFAGAEDKPDIWNIYRFGLIDKQLTSLTDNQGYNAGPREWNRSLSVPRQQRLLPQMWGEVKGMKE